MSDLIKLVGTALPVQKPSANAEEQAPFEAVAELENVAFRAYRVRQVGQASVVTLIVADPAGEGVVFADLWLDQVPIKAAAKAYPHGLTGTLSGILETRVRLYQGAPRSDWRFTPTAPIKRDLKELARLQAVKAFAGVVDADEADEA